MMKCRQCGTELEKNNKTCPHCGYVHSLDHILKEIKIPNELKHLSTKQIKLHLDRQQFISKRRYILIGIVVFLIGFINLFFYFRNPNTNRTVTNFHDDLIEITSTNAAGNSVANIVNGGRLIQYGNDIYVTDDTGVYKINITLNKAERLLNTKASYLNFTDHGFYYIDKKDSNLVCLYDFNSKSVSKLNIHATQIVSVGNYLYYLEDNMNRAIYQYDKTTTSSKKMTQSACVQFKIIGDWLYFTTDDGFFQMPILGGEIMKLSSDPLNHFMVEDQTIFYIDKITNYIQTIKKDGSQKTTLIKSESDCFLLYDQYMFYTLIDGGLMKLDRETGIVTQITSETANNLHIAGTWIYYLNENNEGRFVSIDENNEMITPISVIPTVAK